LANSFHYNQIQKSSYGGINGEVRRKIKSNMHMAIFKTLAERLINELRRKKRESSSLKTKKLRVLAEKQRQIY
jgi:hypothetical protein